MSKAEFLRRYEACPELKQAAHTPGVQATTNTTIRLEGDNEPRLDVLLRLDEGHGGQTRIEGKFLVGPPEVVAEVSSTITHHDLHDKFDLFEEIGVREYLVWRVWDAAIDWFVLAENGTYDRLSIDENGLFKSLVLPGLWLDSAAMVRGDMKRVLEALNQGIQSDEHRTFVQQPRAT